MVKVTPTNFCRIGRRTFVLSEICGLYPRVYMVRNRRPIISKSSILLSHRNNLNSKTHDLIKVKINRKYQVTDKIKKKNLTWKYPWISSMVRSTMGVQFLTCIRQQTLSNISRLDLLLMVHVLYFSYSRRMLELASTFCSISFTETSEPTPTDLCYIRELH